MREKEKKIGFFGGSFDPIHIGHLQLALEAKEKYQLDQILFCPAFISPFKLNSPSAANAKDRFEMVKLAICPIDGFDVIDLEIENCGPSYTIDTIKKLKNLNPTHQYFLILGEDQLHGFSRWKDSEQLKRLAPLIIGSRLGSQGARENTHSNLDINAINFFKISNLEISSTYIRDRIAKKLFVSHLLPPKVVDYIALHGLYLTP
jgi:nicotinate-nucleotide adenylyltransferase